MNVCLFPWHYKNVLDKTNSVAQKIDSLKDNVPSQKNITGTFCCSSQALLCFVLMYLMDEKDNSRVGLNTFLSDGCLFVIQDVKNTRSHKKD